MHATPRKNNPYCKNNTFAHLATRCGDVKHAEVKPEEALHVVVAAVVQHVVVGQPDVLEPLRGAWMEEEEEEEGALLLSLQDALWWWWWWG